VSFLLKKDNMKTNTVKLNGNRQTSLTDAEFVERLKLEDEKAVVRAKADLEKMEIIIHYQRRGGRSPTIEAAIGYLDGKLVELSLLPGVTGLQCNEITLRDALGWLEKMSFANKRLEVDESSSFEGLQRFYRELQTAIA
jgi:hypothetical protein